MMTIIPIIPTVSSIAEIPSIVKKTRTIIIFSILGLLKNPNEVYIVNTSEEIGGTSTSIFVGHNSGMKARLSFIYRGLILGNPFIKSANGEDKINKDVNIEIDSVSYASIMNGCSGYKQEEQSSVNFEANLTGIPTKYPSSEILRIPHPKFYTESHQVLSGLDRDDWFEKVMAIGNTEDYIIPIRELIDDNTSILSGRLDLSDWYENKYSDNHNLTNGIPNNDNFKIVHGSIFVDGLVRFITNIQFAIMVNLVDSMTIIVDPEEGFFINNYRSLLNPLYRGIRNTQSFKTFSMLIENAYQEMREYFEFKGRLLLDITNGVINIKVFRKDNPNINLKKSRTQSDVLFYDFDNYLSGG